MTKGVQRILQLNDIPSDSLDQAIYQDIREMFLSEICSYIKASEAHCLEIKRIYYSTSDDSLAVRKIVRKICGGAIAGARPEVVGSMHQSLLSQKNQTTKNFGGRTGFPLGKARKALRNLRPTTPFTKYPRGSYCPLGLCRGRIRG